MDEDIAERIDDLRARIRALERVGELRESLAVGDETRVVVTDPNYGEDRDPFTRIGGVPTFIKCPDDFQPTLGESIHVRVADVREDVIEVVALTEEN